jgi:hypothetical protein
MMTLGQFLYFGLLRPSPRKEMEKELKEMGINHLIDVYHSKVFLEQYLDPKFRFESKEGDEYYTKSPVIETRSDARLFKDSVIRFVAEYTLYHQTGVGYYWQRKN